MTLLILYYITDALHENMSGHIDASQMMLNDLALGGARKIPVISPVLSSLYVSSTLDGKFHKCAIFKVDQLDSFTTSGALWHTRTQS